MSDQLWEISIDLPRDLRERAVAQLLGIAPEGFEEREISEEELRFIFYRPAEEDASDEFVREFAGLISLLGLARSALNMRRVEAEDWVQRTRERLGPVQVGTLRIEPPWCEEPAGPGITRAVISPGPAFGTGHHESTRLALRELGTCMDELRPSRVLDVGCGTGVLAIFALLLGADEAYGCDISPDAVACAAENAQRNGVGKRLHLFCADVNKLPTDDWPEEFPLVLANLTMESFRTRAGALRDLTASGGRLVASGLYAGEARRMDRVFSPDLWRRVRRAAEGSWHVLVLERTT